MLNESRFVPARGLLIALLFSFFFADPLYK